MDEKERLDIELFELTAAIKEASKKFKDSGSGNRDECLNKLLLLVDILSSEIAFNLFTISIFCTPPEEDLTTWYMDKIGKEMIQDIPKIIEDKVIFLQKAKVKKDKNGC